MRRKALFEYMPEVHHLVSLTRRRHRSQSRPVLLAGIEPEASSYLNQSNAGLASRSCTVSSSAGAMDG